MTSLLFNLKEARLSAGLTQDELADLVGCSRVQISAWENGRVMPTKRYRDALECALDLKVNWNPDAPLNKAEVDAVSRLLRDIRKRKGTSGPEFVLNKNRSELRQLIHQQGYWRELVGLFDHDLARRKDQLLEKRKKSEQSAPD